MTPPPAEIRYQRFAPAETELLADFLTSEPWPFHSGQEDGGDIRQGVANGDYDGDSARTYWRRGPVLPGARLRLAYGVVRRWLDQGNAVDSGGLGGFPPNAVVEGDCRALIPALPDESIDIVICSPPYWGQRTSAGNGVEADPRRYVAELADAFTALLPKVKPDGVLWINLGDAYNTPVNWRSADYAYSTLGPAKAGLAAENSAYAKPRHRRRPFLDTSEAWLRYGNLLALPYRLVVALSDAGWLFRGEVIWRKKNPMPEGRCRRPHRQHEAVYLFARSEQHAFRASPPVGSVWEFASERVGGAKHYSRFPAELPRRCIAAYGRAGPDVVVLDPFSGSGTTGVAALRAGCRYLGFEIDGQQVAASNQRLRDAGRDVVSS